MSSLLSVQVIQSVTAPWGVWRRPDMTMLRSAKHPVRCSRRPLLSTQKSNWADSTVLHCAGREVSCVAKTSRLALDPVCLRKVPSCEDDWNAFRDRYALLRNSERLGLVYDWIE